MGTLGLTNDARKDGAETLDFGSRLKLLCKEQGISQKRLAETVGVSASALSSYVCGTRKPKIETLQSIAAALNASEDYLLHGNEESLEMSCAFSKVISNTRRLNHMQRKALVRELVKAETSK